MFSCSVTTFSGSFSPWRSLVSKKISNPASARYRLVARYRSSLSVLNQISPPGASRVLYCSSCLVWVSRRLWQRAAGQGLQKLIYSRSTPSSGENSSGSRSML